MTDQASHFEPNTMWSMCGLLVAGYGTVLKLGDPADKLWCFSPTNTVALSALFPITLHFNAISARTNKKERERDFTGAKPFKKKELVSTERNVPLLSKVSELKVMQLPASLSGCSRSVSAVFTFLPHYKVTTSGLQNRLKGNYQSPFKHRVRHDPCIPERSIGIQYIRSNTYSYQSAAQSSAILACFAASGAHSEYSLVIGLFACLFHSLILSDKVLSVIVAFYWLPW